MLTFLLIMTTVMSLTMIGFGFLFVKKPPREINSIFGYRTPMSTKNKETWNFAHMYSGKVWIRSGVVTAIISIIFVFALKSLKNYNELMIVLVYIQIAIMLLVIPLTEIALRQTFDKNGNRKQI